MKPPKEKAAEMVERFIEEMIALGIPKETKQTIAKLNANLACDMIIEANPTKSSITERQKIIVDSQVTYYGLKRENKEYYQKVKEEIQKL